MKRETMPPTVFVEKENQPFEKNAIGMKVAITSRVTIPEMMGNARSFLSSIRIRQLAFTSWKLRIIRSNILFVLAVLMDECFFTLLTSFWVHKRIKEC